MQDVNRELGRGVWCYLHEFSVKLKRFLKNLKFFKFIYKQTKQNRNLAGKLVILD